MSYTIRPERKEDYREVENHVETVVILRGVKTNSHKILRILSDIGVEVSRHTETVVILRDKKVDGHIGIDLDVEKIGLNH